MIAATSVRTRPKHFPQTASFPVHAQADIRSPPTGTIGITTYAATQLGDVVFVELPEVGTELNKGDTMGAVESVKSASDINVPVGGKITEINGTLEEKPGNINKSPEGDAWLAKIELADKGELEGLMDAEAYKAFTEESD
jgi:glycine cleavage system H protein